MLIVTSVCATDTYLTCVDIGGGIEERLLTLHVQINTTTYVFMNKMHAYFKTNFEREN
jgi:hypothetical protein